MDLADLFSSFSASTLDVDKLLRTFTDPVTSGKLKSTERPLPSVSLPNETIADQWCAKMVSTVYSELEVAKAFTNVCFTTSCPSRSIADLARACHSAQWPSTFVLVHTDFEQNEGFVCLKLTFAKPCHFTDRTS